MPAILVTSGHAAIAAAVKAGTLHLAWGTGNVAWDAQQPNDYAPGVGETALVAEIGRRAASQKLFCTPDANGELYTPSGRFTASVSPTRYLYCRFDFDYTDAPAAEIREAGVFIGTEIDAGVPGGTTYFVPGDLDSPGTLLILERFPKIVRSTSVRQSFEHVLTL